MSDNTAPTPRPASTSTPDCNSIPEVCQSVCFRSGICRTDVADNDQTRPQICDDPRLEMCETQCIPKIQEANSCGMIAAEDKRFFGISNN